MFHQIKRFFKYWFIFDGYPKSNTQIVINWPELKTVNTKLLVTASTALILLLQNICDFSTKMTATRKKWANIEKQSIKKIFVHKGQKLREILLIVYGKHAFRWKQILVYIHRVLYESARWTAYLVSMFIN